MLIELRRAPGPCRQDALRQALRVKTQRLVQVMRELLDEGVIARTGDGWFLAARPGAASVSGANEGTPLFTNAGAGGA